MLQFFLSVKCSTLIDWTWAEYVLWNHIQCIIHWRNVWSPLCLPKLTAVWK